MPELDQIRSASRSAWLELKEELRLVRDGYEFLDEKRILLATEMLKQRDAYRVARASFMALSGEAAGALQDAAAEQGLDGLQVHPAGKPLQASLIVERRSCVGQTMLEARLELTEPLAGHGPEPATPAVRACEDSYRNVLSQGAALAAMTANLKRLIHEFRRTERRVRALENVVLPEIRGDLARMAEHLDLIEQEEVIRVRTVRVERV